MEIALLNVKIVIQKNTVVVDKIGNHKNELLFLPCHRQR